jgi:Sulfotransferase domain
MASEQDQEFHSSDLGEVTQMPGGGTASAIPERQARIGNGATSIRRQSSPLPTFIIIGAMKAGTTSLFDRLATHPDIGTASIKEPDFFIPDKNMGRGLGWYESLFAGTEGAAARGEASTSYSKCGQFPGVPARIHAVVPDVRLIYLLREPVERIRSMYQHNVLHGRECRAADEAVLADPKYLDASCYGLQAQQYLSVFRPDQLHVLTTDDLRDRPEQTLGAVCAHIGVDWHQSLASETHRSNVTEGRRGETAASRALKSSVTLWPILRHAPAGVTKLGKRILTRTATLDARLAPETVAELRGRLSPDIETLERLLGRSFENWRRASN